ncbi:MAG: 2OG-Fe(II) oxygenase [Proteobacteria bacterium]|nr:2OG-Fe(II) oxygenase [Pseudomonadota bacterium]MBS0463376.1 2OG-Fe(II) oxygenase [Pseudomonadota bacterium]
MISNDLDVDLWRNQLAARSRVQIRDFLQPGAAEFLRNCLATQVPWRTAERSDSATPRTHGREGALDEAGYRAVLDAAYADAGEHFQFVYDSYMVGRARAEGWDPELPLHALYDFLNSDDFIAFARYLTGDTSINTVNAQATRYRRGQFLTVHDDKNSIEGRRYAYVLNLTPRWKADWGGQLQFLDADGNVIDTLLPRWNTLSMFKVPQPHLVSLVSPWAGEDRLAITGWMLVR